MLGPFVQIFKGVRTILGDKNYLPFFILLSPVLFVVMFLIPVKTIPGNEVSFQAQVFGYKDYLLFGWLALLSSLIITMHIYLFKRQRKIKASGTLKSVAMGGAGVFSGVVSSIFSTATCGICISALFSFLGAGTVFYLIDHRFYVVISSTGLLLLSLYFSSQRTNRVCDECMIKKDSPSDAQ